MIETREMRRVLRKKAIQLDWVQVAKHSAEKMSKRLTRMVELIDDAVAKKLENSKMSDLIQGEMSILRGLLEDLTYDAAQAIKE